MPMDNLRYNIFVAGYTVYYLGVAITVVNYVTYGTFFVQAAGYEAPVGCMDEPSETEADAFVPDLKAPLGRWVERKAYLETDTSTDLIAGQLGSRASSSPPTCAPSTAPLSAPGACVCACSMPRN